MGDRFAMANTTQTEMKDYEEPTLASFLKETPKQNNYETMIGLLGEIKDEIFYLRHEWEDNKRDIFDLNELVGMLQNRILILSVKIQKWVGVEEECTCDIRHAHDCEQMNYEGLLEKT